MESEDGVSTIESDDVPFSDITNSYYYVTGKSYQYQAESIANFHTAESEIDTPIKKLKLSTSLTSVSQTSVNSNQSFISKVSNFSKKNQFHIELPPYDLVALPAKLVIGKPSGECEQIVMKLKNVNRDALLFKVLVNQPYYAIRPYQGVIQPKSTAHIIIQLAPRVKKVVDHFLMVYYFVEPPTIYNFATAFNKTKMMANLKIPISIKEKSQKKPSVNEALRSYRASDFIAVPLIRRSDHFRGRALTFAKHKTFVYNIFRLVFGIIVNAVRKTLQYITGARVLRWGTIMIVTMILSFLLVIMYILFYYSNELMESFNNPSDGLPHKSILNCLLTLKEVKTMKRILQNDKQYPSRRTNAIKEMLRYQQCQSLKKYLWEHNNDIE
ncbi:hypothetical protein SNEBB_010322 [Seison nebaliae]|nr:hypothetical protein SNEBB_010322 [Seison nebaliae]